MTSRDKIDILIIIFGWIIPFVSLILAFITDNKIISYIFVGYLLCGILFFVFKFLFAAIGIFWGLSRWAKRQ